MISKKNILIVVVIVLVVVGAGFLINKNNKNIGYSVVYLSTGEIYIGKLSTFPDLVLRDGYILNTVQDATDPKKANFQLTPMNEALWAPQGGVHFIKDNVVFYGSLMSNSKIAETLASQKK